MRHFQCNTRLPCVVCGPAGQRRNFFVLPYEGGRFSTPMTDSHKSYRADYAVVGSGIAGLRAAIELSKAGSVLVLAKSNLSDSATAWRREGSPWPSPTKMKSGFMNR